MMKTLLKRILSTNSITKVFRSKFGELSNQSTEKLFLDSTWTSESYIQNMGCPILFLKTFLKIKIFHRSQHNYRADFLINKGVCADVYEGIHIPTNRKVIIKAITPSSFKFLFDSLQSFEKATSNQFVPKRELTMLSVLQHENIVQLCDYFFEEDSELLCLVLNFVF